MQVLDEAEHDQEYAWSRDQDEAEENKDHCFLAMLFKADSIGMLELTRLSFQGLSMLVNHA